MFFVPCSIFHLIRTIVVHSRSSGSLQHAKLFMLLKFLAKPLNVIIVCVLLLSVLSLTILGTGTWKRIIFLYFLMLPIENKQMYYRFDIRYSLGCNNHNTLMMKTIITNNSIFFFSHFFLFNNNNFCPQFPAPNRMVIFPSALKKYGTHSFRTQMVVIHMCLRRPRAESWEPSFMAESVSW